MISVILPNYNHAPFLKERIDSILNQTYQDFELIILDDKSPDNSKDIIEEYRNNSHISHIIYNDENSGSTFKQWKKGIDLALGEYIWIAESDDYAAPSLLQTLYDNINKEKNINISFCQSYKVDENSNIIGDCSDNTEDIALDLFSKDFILDGKEFIKKYLIKRNVIPNASAVLFRRSIFIDTGGADYTIGFSGDWFVWLKITAMGKIAFSSQKCNYYRRHSKSIVTAAIANKEINKDLFLKKYDLKMRVIYQKYIEQLKYPKSFLDLNKSYITDDYMVEARYLWIHKQHKEALKHWFMSFLYSKNKYGIMKRGVTHLIK